MKKCIIPFIVISTVVLFTSCQKDASIEPTGVTNKVKTYTEAITSTTIGNSITTYNLAFDAGDRIISMISASDPRYKFLFKYSPNNAFSTDIYNHNGLQVHEDVFLNKNLSADSTFQYNNTGDTSTEKYFYNGGNLPVTSNEYDYSQITGSVLSNTINYSYDVKGNLVLAAGTDTYNEEWEFYQDIVYLLPNVQPYFRRITNVNLIKKHTVTSNGNLVGSATYTYTFDSNHRLSTETAVSDAGDIVVKMYTYY
jgi:hypothetical protein